MSIKDDYKRLIFYAKGLGLSVILKQARKGDPAATWTSDGSEICVYESPTTSTTSHILCLIHELAHHLAFLERKREPEHEVNRVLTLLEEGGEASKADRKIIYKMESHDSKFQYKIWKDLNLSIKKYKVLAEKDLSNWGYMVYWRSGNDPTSKQFIQKRKELREKYKQKEVRDARRRAEAKAKN